MNTLMARNLNGRRILVLFVLTNLVYASMLTVTIPRVMSFAPGLRLLDMMPTGYSPDYVQVLLQTLGWEGRNVYLFQQLPLDFLYPGMFALCYGLLLAFLLKKLNRTEGWLWYFCYLPVVAGGFDYLENIGIVVLLSTFPELSVGVAKLTSSFSIAKSVSTTLYFIVLLSVFFVLFANFLHARIRKSVAQH